MKRALTGINLKAEALADTRINAACGVKMCTTCSALKPLGSFPMATAGIGAVASVCKDCSSTYGKARRLRKRETDVIYKVNVAILKRQSYGTDCCLISEKSAYLAAAHLLDEYGLLTVENGHTFKSLFKNNHPSKLKKHEDRVALLAERKEARKLVSLETAKLRAVEKAERKAQAADARRGSVCQIELTDENLDELLYSRLRHHLKKKKRSGATAFSFTKANFVSLTGYTPGELRQHLSTQLPIGKSWADVVSCELHIDHITPSAAFDLTTLWGLRACYAMSNLTFLPADENASKGVTRDKATVAHFRSDPELARLFGLAE